MDNELHHELQRAISGPVSASIQTMNNSSFLVFSDKILEEDSDEEDLDRYTDVGLREQLFITLSRAIRSTQNTETKITETAVPDSIKNKRGPQRRKLNPQSNTSHTHKHTHSPRTNNIPLSLPTESYSKYNDSHTNAHNNDLQYHTHKPKKMKLKSQSYSAANANLSKNASLFKNISPIRSSPNHHTIMTHKRKSQKIKIKPKKRKNKKRKAQSHKEMHIPKLRNDNHSAPFRKANQSQNKKHKRQHSNIRNYNHRLNHDFDMKMSANNTYILDEYTHQNRDRNGFKPMPLPHTHTHTILPHRKPKLHNGTMSDCDMITALEQVRKDKSEEILHNLPKTSHTPKAKDSHNINAMFNKANTENKHRKRKRKVPRHISSRGMPPPPNKRTDTRHNTHYLTHKGKANSYRDIPPPPKTPPPKNRRTLSHMNTLKHTHTSKAKPKGRRRGNGVQRYKHSYNGPSYGPTVNMKPKPQKSPPVLTANPMHNGYRNRTRSRSKDSIDVKVKPVHTTVDNRYNWIPPPPQGSPQHKYRHSVAITKSSPKTAIKGMNNIEPNMEALELFGAHARVKNERKYNTMGAYHSAQYSNHSNSSIDSSELSVGSHSNKSNSTDVMEYTQKRPSQKHKPIQVYTTPPIRNKLDKIKINTLSQNISPMNYENIPSNVREVTPSPLTSPRNHININQALDPISDHESENNYNHSPLTAQQINALQPLQDNNESEDSDPNLDNANTYTIKISDNEMESDNQIEEDDPGESDIPRALPDYLSASEYLLCDPTLDPKRNLKKLNKNPVKNIRARGATWIGKTNTDNNNGLPLNNHKMKVGLSPSTTTMAMGARVDRTDSLADRFRGVQMKDGHIVLSGVSEFKNESIPQTHAFKNGFPAFKNIHQRFAQQFTNDIFDGHLKSYERAFMPIAPQHLGLIDFSNIRSRRRAVFGGNKLGPSKQFTDDQSVMDVSIERRNDLIAKYIAQNEFLHKKRFKKSFGNKERKKKYKLSDTFSDNSYSLSIHTSHKSTSSITPHASIHLYPEHYHTMVDYDIIVDAHRKNKHKNKKTWQKLLSFGKRKKRFKGGKRKKTNSSTLEYTLSSGSTDPSEYKSLTLDDPSDITANTHRRLSRKNSHLSDKGTTKDDMLYGSMPSFEIHGFDYTDSMYTASFKVSEISENISANMLRRGDLIFVMDYEHIDVENEDLNSFLSKYNIDNFLKRMSLEESKRNLQFEMVKQRSTMRLLSKQSRRSFLNKQPSNNENLSYVPPPQTLFNRPRSANMDNISEENGLSLAELQDLQILNEWKNKNGAAHCMLVLQNIGSSVEVAHVTSTGGTRSFIRQFDAEKIAHTLYIRNTKMRNCKIIKDETATKCVVAALGRGPPVAYRCVAYRLNTQFASAKKFANEAANVAENLVKGGRVLGDPAVFAGSMERYMENPEKYFYRFLLSSNASLFRRTVRLQFDEGTSFFNFSSSEFVALCFQRALVNKKSFDRQLIRLLDFCPHLTPPPLLQKYIHLNIDEHADWRCLGNIFFSYL